MWFGFLTHYRFLTIIVCALIATLCGPRPTCKGNEGPLSKGREGRGRDLLGTESAGEKFN